MTAERIIPSRGQIRQRKSEREPATIARRSAALSGAQITQSKI
jgi:hypothetical protein